MQTTRQENFWIKIICGIAVLISLVLYNPFPLYFLNDDLIHIPLSGRGELFQRNSFRPICDWSIQLDYLLWGKTASGYHVTNLLLHAADSLLVYFFVKQLCKSYFIEKAFLHALPVATLFFIYAFHSETVYWIIGRSASLAVLFFLPSCIFYLKRNEGGKYFALSLLFFGVGLMTYESVWIFPMFAALISFTDRQTSIQKELKWIVSVLLLFFIFLLVRYTTLGEIAGQYESQLFTRFEISGLLFNFSKLLTRTFFPPAINPMYFMTAVLAGIFILVMLFFVMGKRRKDGFLLQFILPLLIFSLLPYLSLGVDSHTSEGERFLYMPSIFASFFLLRVSLLATKWQKGFLLLFSALLFYHIFYLYKSFGHYRTASTIVRETFNNINALHEKELLVIDSLPQSFKGALIFRSGFEQGLEWLKRPGTVREVQVHSLKEENRSWNRDFKVVYPKVYQMPSIDRVLIKRKMGEGYEISPVNPFQLNKQTDAWFIYSNENLQVMR